MISLYRLYEIAEREIELIEQDDLIDDERKKQAIKDIYDELREAAIIILLMPRVSSPS